MPTKALFVRFQPAPLYIVLVLSICYFSVQLILSHLTHALTLLMASYHMLCNIFALAGSIVTIKHNEFHNTQEHSSLLSLPEDKQKTIFNVSYCDDTNIPKYPAVNSPEFKTRNTFGWARIEILTMLVVCITLASLSFSLLVEALQTLVHIDHQDSMHLPFHVMILGFVGLLLNGFTYFVIGGYTLHQGNFLHINPTDGKVIVEPSNLDSDSKILAVADNGITDQNLKENLKSELGKVHYRTRREGPGELLRDVSSTIFVIVCAVVVHFAKDKEHTAKFIDPVLSIFSCILLVALSYPYMKEACLILLQTIPGNINMDHFEGTLVKKFPQIISYHDLHIWQLSSHKYIATVHIIFQNPKIYAKTIDEVRQHFHDHSIANVTIQPEFYDENTTNSSSVECLMQCTKPECLDKVCCKDSMTDLREISICSGPDNDEHMQEHRHPHGHDHVHDKQSGGKSKTHSDHQGHGHSHPQDYSIKKDQKHENKYAKALTNIKPEVPNENLTTTETLQIHEIPTEGTTKACKNTPIDMENSPSHTPEGITKTLENNESFVQSQNRDSQLPQDLNLNKTDMDCNLNDNKL